MHFQSRILRVHDKHSFKAEVWGTPPAARLQRFQLPEGLVISSSWSAHTSTSPFSFICFFCGKQTTPRERPLLAISAILHTQLRPQLALCGSGRSENGAFIGFPSGGSGSSLVPCVSLCAKGCLALVLMGKGKGSFCDKNPAQEPIPDAVKLFFPLYSRVL